MKAHYHTEGNAPHELTVLKKHENGKIDIGPEGGPAIVTECEVLAEPKAGYATLVEEVKSKTK